MSSPVWIRRRARQRRLRNARKLRRLLVRWNRRWVPPAHYEHVHVTLPSYHASGLAVDVNRPS